VPDARLLHGLSTVCIVERGPATTLRFYRSDLSSLYPDMQLDARVLAFSGRLLAYVTDEAPKLPGPDGQGDIVTSRSRSRPRIASDTETRPTASTLISSAVGLGGVAARGVLAGIRLGARAANQARVNQLARSAPVEGSLLVEEDLSESRSLEEEVLPPTSPAPAQWIKIIDVKRSRTVAHFRVPVKTLHSVGEQGISLLSFSPDGTQLTAAQADGKACHVFQIHPGTKSEVLHLYELRRGNTVASVKEIVWDARWIGVATGRGTIRECIRHRSHAEQTSTPFIRSLRWIASTRLRYLRSRRWFTRRCACDTGQTRQCRASLHRCGTTRRDRITARMYSSLERG
jgi:hypothetical protein